jgi:hypothetical protein
MQADFGQMTRIVNLKCPFWMTRRLVSTTTTTNLTFWGRESNAQRSWMAKTGRERTNIRETKMHITVQCHLSGAEGKDA